MRPGPRQWVPVAVLVACLALAAWLIFRLGPARVVAAARAADGPWLAASLLPIVVRFLLWATKWRWLLRDVPEVTFGFALRSILAGAFANLTTPTAKLAGGFLRAAMLHRRSGSPRLRCYGLVLADQWSNLLGNLAVVGVAGLAAAATLGEGRAAVALRGGGIAAGGFVVAALVLGRPLARRLRDSSLARRIAARLPVAWRGLDDDPGALLFEPLAGRPTLRLLADVGLAAAALGALCLAHAWALRSLGLDVPLAGTMTAVATGYLAGTLSGTMGGLGATEAALIELQVMVGVSGSAAGAAALLHRAGFYAVTLVWGGWALWRQTRSID